VTDDQLGSDIAELRAAHARLHRRLGGVDDTVLRRDSRLPGWTVGHVLVHLARNADSVVRRLTSAAAGELVDQYPGGSAARSAEIDAGVRRPAADVLADLRQADDRLDRTVQDLDAAVWTRPVRLGDGGEVPAAALVFRRWREVEVHSVDLGIGPEPADWPLGLIERWLPSLLAGLPDRADPRQLVAWATGRGPAPVLPPWG
jgi:maleylpyruvate isomerase